MLFQKGHKDLVPKKSRLMAGMKMRGTSSPSWKGGKPKCILCGKTLHHYRKNSKCRECYKKHLPPSKFKGTHFTFNTGRTHFKKGIEAWNKGIPCSEFLKNKMSKERKGKPNPKPSNFSDTMRKVNPPQGRKIKFDSRDKDRKLRVWRKGYIFIYKPDHISSRKSPPDYGYVSEHRMVMENHLKRILEPFEVIHHIDGDKSNNKLDNLLLCKKQKYHNEVHTQMEMFVEKLIREGKVYYERGAGEFRFR